MASASRNTPPIRRKSADFEEQLRALEGRFHQLRGEVRQLQQLSMLGTAATMMAHEVNNFLTPLLSYTQSALESDDPALNRKALEAAYRSAQILAGMSQRILTIASVRDATPSSSNLRENVTAARDSLCRDPKKDGIDVVINIPEACEVWADPLHVQQVFFNLLLNACKALADTRHGRIIVDVTDQGDVVEVTVRDNGPGFPAAIVDTVFDPFCSTPVLNQGRPYRNGLGLGLALCRDLVGEVGGRIEAANAEDGGAVVRVTLLKARPAQPSPALVRPSVPSH